MNHTYIKKRRSKNAIRGAIIASLFAVCGSASFLVGLNSVSDIDPAPISEAQVSQTTNVNVILQYQSVSGDIVPIEVTQFMNGSQTSLALLQEIHTGVVFPSNPTDRCPITNPTGRCNFASVPVGDDGNGNERQYDLLIDTFAIETVAGIPLQTNLAAVRFSQSACGPTEFTADLTESPNNAVWCLSDSNLHTIEVTLLERNTCTTSIPPASFCNGNGTITTFECNPSTSASTNPFEPVNASCQNVQCPDGNFTAGQCQAISGVAVCSTAAACSNNQLCSVQSFSSFADLHAGTDTIIIRGDRFGTLGGSVSFPTTGTEREVVQVFAGADWTNTEIRARIPLNAVSGTLEIHPNTHGFTDDGTGTLTPVSCSSPPASILALNDQFSIISVSGQSPSGRKLVSPGFATDFTIIAQHNDAVSRFDSIVIELVDGAFASVDTLPLNRSIITQNRCDASVVGSPSARQGTMECELFVPESVASFEGPFTFVITLFDDAGGSSTVTILDAGDAILLGDLNLDGRLSIADAVEARRISSGTSSASADALLRDPDGSGAITREDVTFILHSLTQ